MSPRAVGDTRTRVYAPSRGVGVHPVYRLHGRHALAVLEQWVSFDAATLEPSPHPRTIAQVRDDLGTVLRLQVWDGRLRLLDHAGLERARSAELEPDVAYDVHALIDPPRPRMGEQHRLEWRVEARQ